MGTTDAVDEDDDAPVPGPWHVAFDVVSDLAGTIDAIRVFRAVWGPDDVHDVDTYFAAATHGSYLGVGRASGSVVAAAFGLLSTDPVTGRLGLHSHMAAVLPGATNHGLGRALKAHQRAWCLERGIDAITWTFDPLQRRNAWFNLVTLGATVIGFHENLYGALNDSINGSDETDRFEVRWALNAACGGPVNVRAGDVVVPIPGDIDGLRRHDPERARAERLGMRSALAPIRSGSVAVAGITADGAYVLRPSAEVSSATAAPC